jgi:hypothetical protein
MPLRINRDDVLAVANKMVRLGVYPSGPKLHREIPNFCAEALASVRRSLVQAKILKIPAALLPRGMAGKTCVSAIPDSQFREMLSWRIEAAKKLKSQRCGEYIYREDFDAIYGPENMSWGAR